MSSRSSRQAPPELAQLLIQLGALQSWLLTTVPETSQASTIGWRIGRAQLRLYMHLFQHGPMILSDLARGLGVTTAATSLLVTKEIERGGVERFIDDDGRRVLLRLSPQTEEFSQMIFDQRISVLQRVWKSADPAERAAFTKVMDAILESVEESMGGTAIAGRKKKI